MDWLEQEPIPKKDAAVKFTDTEKRIFLSAMRCEEMVCKAIDDEKVDDGTAKLLLPICHSIERKVKEALWT